MVTNKRIKDSLIMEKMEAQSRLAAALAHKVNNPLTYVMNYLFILKQEVSSSEAERLIASIESGISKSTDMLNRLVDLSCPAIENMSDISPSDIIEEIIKALPKHQSILIENKVSRSSSCVAGMKGLRTVIMNLIENSVDAGADNIFIESSEDKRMLTLVIKDNGKGFKKNEMEIIFEPYYTNKPKREGLGLYSSFHIIRTFDGLLWCNNTSDNGSEFCIMLRRNS